MYDRADEQAQVYTKDERIERLWRISTTGTVTALWLLLRHIMYHCAIRRNIGSVYRSARNSNCSQKNALQSRVFQLVNEKHEWKILDH